MRPSQAIKFVFMVGIVSCLITICFWSTCATRPLEVGSEDRAEYDSQGNFILTKYHKRGTNSINGEGVESMQVIHPDEYHELECNINSETTIKCRREGNEIYMPFSFIKNYFEVFGEVQETDGYERFEFHHSNSIVHPPRPTYTPGSVFMAFDYYNVENRDRVKCVTASEGVPITTQWNKDGYHYPIQVAQYGLSHHAKHIVNGDPDQIVLEDGEEDNLSDWVMPDKKSQVKTDRDADKKTRVVEFLTSDSLHTKGITIVAADKNNKCIIMDVKFVTNGSVTVVVELTSGETMNIHYVFTNNYISFDGKSNIYYGMGERRTHWMRLARDLKFDLMKGLLLKVRLDKIKESYGLTRVKEIKFHGHGWLDNLTLSYSVHVEQFYDAANWLVQHQDQRGGWPIMVQRRVVTGILELSPGWYSAMGQGQAMSVLVRAYLDSKDDKYLQVAINALNLFEVDSSQGGVRAKFLGQFDWYEEYPTTPSSFVLNGFIYSLLGLYDLKETASGAGKERAERLYNSGMKSLKAMIGMYDSGCGTFYDLRHITVGIEPNRARWDYHTTHINQLLQLMIIDDDEIFKTTVQRWLGYLKGKKSRHN
ncbi:D-glucuronyl C5-epimerase [Biomphalaria glabrata]|nr:D-glucuronyl C5-epimerase-like [Biomphalaria glabrata]KAI8795366.1 D-glucuronyl C5-epimerase [Biomphalaria glabrata]